MSESSSAHAADTEYFVRRGMTKGPWLQILAQILYQHMRVITQVISMPPCFPFLFTPATFWPGGAGVHSNSVACSVLLGLVVLSVRHYVTSRKYLPNAALLTGVASGGAFEYVRVARADENSVRARRLRTAYDVSTPM